MKENREINQDFKHNLTVAKTLAGHLPQPQDRQKVVKWLKKLSVSDRTDQQKKLRNEYMYYLIKNLQMGELSEPFKSNPPPGLLPLFHQMIPGGIESFVGSSAMYQGQIDTTAGMWAAGESHRPLLFKNSPDGGAFLANQPIPKRGAYCYIAVVAKPKNS